MKSQIKILLIALMGLSFILLSPFFIPDKKLFWAQAQNEGATGESSGELIIPGRIQGVGKYFEIKNSRYLDISLESSEEIKVVLESIPKIINLNIGAVASSSISTELKIENLEPNQIYYKYQDSYKNKIILISDAQGVLRWTQDLAAAHHVWLQETESTTYIERDTTLEGDLEGSVEIAASNITLDCQGHQIIGTSSGFGIYLNNKTGVTIQNCLIRNFIVGIYVFGNRASNNNILANDVFNNEYGIRIIADYWLLFPGNNIAQNKIYSNYWGMEIEGHNSNRLTGNNIFNNSEIGFLLHEAPLNRLRNNVISSNKYNFGVYSAFAGASQDIDTSNTVNGKPIYYLVNQENKIIDASSNPGYVGVVNSKNITIKDVTLNGNVQGIYLEEVKDSLIDNVKVSGNRIGIEMNLCSGNQIMGSTISENNYRAGIVLWLSTDNIIADNDISSHENYGLNLSGMWNAYSHDNKIYHNNFINNNTNIRVERSYNDVFDNGYPSGGNYFSDYTGADVLSGPLQDQLGADGIGDTPYYFFPGVTYLGYDRYPLMEPVEINPSQKWSFALISDLHVGQFIQDYGDATWNDGVSGDDDIVSVKNLKNIIDLINLNIENYDLKFVVVDGDFTNSAELSELNKAKEILDFLNIPWIPLLGNHDIWPYYGSNPDFINREAEMAPEIDVDYLGTDKYFSEVFSSQYQKLPASLRNWIRENYLVWNLETNPQHYSAFQNFAFDYNSFHFIGLDFNSRDIENYPAKGAAAEGNLDNFLGGTQDWLQRHLQQYITKHSGGGKNIILFAHHPFRKDYWQEYFGIKFYNIGFADDELETLNNSLAPYRDRIFALFAGHTHENKITALGEGGIKTIETAANVNNPLARIVQIYPNGDINYSDMLGYDLVITAHSPVDLKVTTPGDLIITKGTNQILGIEYIEEDLDGDGDLDDRILILDREPGNYKIEIIPDGNASADATYTLDVAELENDFGYVPVVLAENVPIEQIPDNPYFFEVKQKNVTQLTYLGGLSGQYSDLVNLSAVLIDEDGAPIAGKNIVFQIGAQSVSAITNAVGIASANLNLTSAPGEYYFIEANFAGDMDYLPAFAFAQFEIIQKDVAINVLNVDGFALTTSTLKAQILDGDGDVLLGDPRAVEFKVGARVIGEAGIDENGDAKIDWNVDLIPKDLTEDYPIIAVFAGDEYYSPAQGQGIFTLKSAQWLKKDAIIQLQANLSGNKLLINEIINEIIKHIQNSLTDNLWLNASHLTFLENCGITESDVENLNLEKDFNSPNKAHQKIKCLLQNSGLKVFLEEYLAIKLMDNFLTKLRSFDKIRPVFEGAIDKLVRTDKLLAIVALQEAQDAQNSNPSASKIIARLLTKADKQFSKAQDELSKGKPDKAIIRLAISWLYSQIAIKLVN